jgi:hypothetical protein
MKDVFSNILPQHLGFKDYLNFSLTCKEYYSMLNVPKKRDETQKKITKLFPTYIIDMIGKNRFLYAKEIEWNPEWLGGTSYIDSMRPVDFKDDPNSIYYGVDSYSRPFVFLKTRVTKIETGISKETIISLFQRYTDSTTFAAVDNTASGEILLQHRARIDDELCLRIQTFLETKRLQNENTVMEIFY